jgi:protein pelota
MRLLKSQIEQKTGAGFATFLPEEPEDMVSMDMHYYGYC